MASVSSIAVLNNTADSAVLAARSSYEKFREVIKNDLETSTPKPSSIIDNEVLALEGVRRIIEKRRSKAKRAEGLKALEK